MEGHTLVSRQAGTVLSRRRIFILPTSYGMLFFVMLLVMLIGAINYNNNLGYLLTFLLFSMSLVCILYTYRNLVGLTWQGGKCDSVFAGDQARFSLYFDNRDSLARFSIELLRIPDKERGWRFHRRNKSVPVTSDITADSISHIDLTVQTSNRGKLPVGRIRLSSCFPLGLFHAWSTIEPELQCLVYPAPEGQSGLPEAAAIGNKHHGGTHAGNDDFAGFRSYAPGDSMRHIAWKAMARNEEALVKRFSGNGSPRLWLHWDFLGYLDDDEARLSQLCRWVVEAERQNLVYGLMLPETTITQACGDQHQIRCLQALALYGSQETV